MPHVSHALGPTLVPAPAAGRVKNLIATTNVSHCPSSAHLISMQTRMENAIRATNTAISVQVQAKCTVWAAIRDTSCSVSLVWFVLMVICLFFGCFSHFWVSPCVLVQMVPVWIYVQWATMMRSRNVSHAILPVSPVSESRATSASPAQPTCSERPKSVWRPANTGSFNSSLSSCPAHSLELFLIND